MKTLSAAELDRKFDNGEDMSEYVDWSSSYRPNLPKRVNLDLQEWMVAAIDREAKHLGVTRQSLIKVWLAQKLDTLRAERRKFTAPAGPADKPATSGQEAA